MNIDDDLKTQPNKFWRCIPSFTKHNSYTTYLHVNGNDVLKPVKVTGVPAKYFQSLYRTSPVAITMAKCPVIFSVASHFRIRHFECSKPLRPPVCRT